MKKTIITVVGKDTVGIIAKVCTYLADNQVNILDITQTILDGYFNMMMIADMEACSKDFLTVANDLESVALTAVGSGFFILRRLLCSSADNFAV